MSDTSGVEFYQELDASIKEFVGAHKETTTTESLAVIPVQEPGVITVKFETVIDHDKLEVTEEARVCIRPFGRQNPFLELTHSTDHPALQYTIYPGDDGGDDRQQIVAMADRWDLFSGLVMKGDVPLNDALHTITLPIAAGQFDPGEQMMINKVFRFLKSRAEVLFDPPILTIEARLLDAEDDFYWIGSVTCYGDTSSEDQAWILDRPMLFADSLIGDSDGNQRAYEGPTFGSPEVLDGEPTETQRIILAGLQRVIGN